MFFIVAALFLLLLCLCKRLSRTAFAVVEGAACFIWVFVQYWTYFQDLVHSALPLWVLASLAALAIPTRKRGGAEGMGAPAAWMPRKDKRGAVAKTPRFRRIPFSRRTERLTGRPDSVSKRSGLFAPSFLNAS